MPGATMKFRVVEEKDCGESCFDSDPEQDGWQQLLLMFTIPPQNVHPANWLLCVVLGLSFLLSPGCADRKESATSESGHERMLALLQEVEQESSYEALAEDYVHSLRDRLAVLAEHGPVFERWQLKFELGMAELAQGNEQVSIRHLMDARKLVPQLKDTVDPNALHTLTFRLGVAFMRVGETENCCARNSPDSCILPIRGEGIHTEREGSQRAIEYFMEVLEETPPGSELHLASQWLLNVAYMTLGRYPDSVPVAHLIPPRAFQSEEEFPRFINIASKMGLDTFSLGGGAIGDDFDNDGNLDLMVSTWDASGQIRFHRNNGDGTFTDRTVQAGLTGILGGLNLLHADYDNDGHLDVLVLRGAWLGRAGRQPNSLLHNNGDGTFTDTTFEAGLGEDHRPSQTASWADYDNDGDLDLYVGNEAKDDDFPCQLFQNNGDGTFTDVAESAGVENLGFTKAVVWGDYNADRFPDLYVSNLLNPNRLYKNNGDGTFTDVAQELGVAKPRRSFPSWFWDFDNDGNLDLFVAAYNAGIDELAAAYLELEVGRKNLPRLYQGDGKGGFREVSREKNLARPSAPMGSNFGDLDGDGYLDFYLGTGYPDYKQIMPNIMYHNRRGRDFKDVTVAGGFGHLQKGHGVVFADLDHDGDQDIFEQMGGAYPGDGFNDALYENPGFGNHWVNVKLVGVQSNRSAIGARIRIDFQEEGQQRTVYRYVNSGGTFGCNPLRQNVGLGAATAIESLEIFWPTTGHTQRFTDVPTDRFIQIVEGQEHYEILPMRSYKFILSSFPRSLQDPVSR